MPRVGIAKDRTLSAALTQAGIARFYAVSIGTLPRGIPSGVIPCSATGTRLYDTSFYTNCDCHATFGALVCAPHTCKSVKPLLSHRKLMDSVVENLPGVRLMRHSALNDLIKRSLKSHPDSSQNRSPDQMVSVQKDCRLCSGNTVTVDMFGVGRDGPTCPDTLAQSHLNSAVTDSGVVQPHSLENTPSTKLSVGLIVACQ